MAGWTERIRAARRDADESSYLQYNLLRSLAFGERDWLVLYATLCHLSPAPRDFWTLPGVAGFVAGVFCLGPIYGVFIHLATKAVYFALKARGRLPADLDELTWAGNTLCMPFVIVLGWALFDTYFDLVAGVLGFFGGK